MMKVSTPGAGSGIGKEFTTLSRNLLPSLIKNS